MTGLTVKLGAGLIFAALVVGAPSAGPALAGVAAGQGAPISDNQVAEALVAIDAAESYAQLLDTLTRFRAVITSERALEIVDSRLEMTNLGEQLRLLLMLMRELFIEARESTETAAELMAVRLIATGAVSGNPEQLTSLLEGFPGLAPKLNAAVIARALKAPDLDWPTAMPSLLVQLGEDWRKSGARTGATNITTALRPAPTGSPTPGGPTDERLVGRWQFTRIMITGSPQDTNLVFDANGAASIWTTTSAGAEAPTAGRWSTRGNFLTIAWADGTVDEAPYTFFQNELIFPNLEGARRNFARLQ